MQFGAFQLNLRESELTKHGRKIRVPNQSLQILAMLLEFPGEMVTREELHARLWPNGTIVEFEHSINSAIKRPRTALGDSAEKPRFIETLPRRGYRFIFPVEPPASDELPETISPCKARHGSHDFAGQKISHYQLFEKVGQGAIGVVYKAEDLRLGRTVVLKFLTEELSTDPKAQERFQREARAASALNHRNICTIYEVDEEDGRLLIAMEYVAGKPLDQFIGPNPITVDELLSYAVQAAEALAAAHAAGIVHRDLKPSNIMVGADGQLKVLDFGLAKIEHREPKAWQAEALTNAGVVMGTVRYMSPEQALGHQVDRRSDIFSLGVVLYELATGRPLFLGDSSSAIIDAILHSVPTPVRRLNPELSPDMGRIIEKSLNKDPNLRYQTAGEMRADLERAIRTPKSAGETNVVSKKRLKWFIALASLVLIAALASRWRFVRTMPHSGGAPRIIPLTSDPGFQEAPALSPDGKRVAYTWDGDKGDNSDIYVKAADGGGPLRLTTDPAYDGSPAWAPDGRNIAFGRLLQDHVEILSIPAFGGPERKLGEAKANGISWSPNGKFLAVVDQESPDKPRNISLLSIEASEKRRLTSPPSGGTGDELPKFSPDGRSLAFLRSRNLASSDLYVLSIADIRFPGKPRRLTFDDQAEISDLDWTSDGRSIVFSSWGPGCLSSSLWSIPAAGGTPQRMALTGENVSSLSISRAGNRLVYTHGIGVANIWRIPGPSSLDKAALPMKLLASKQHDREPAFSPDGRSIAFCSSRTGDVEIWISDSEGHSPLQLTSLNGPMLGSPSWSPDGRSIAFDSTKEGNSNIYIVSAAGGPIRRLTAGAANDVHPTWSRDGKWIYFGSNRSGDWQVWKVSVQSGATFQVTKRGGRDALESADGKSIYCAKLFRPGIWRVPVEGGEETKVLDQGRMFRWTLTNQGILLAEGSLGTIIKFYAFDNRRLTTIREFPKDVHVVDCPVVSPDGRWILYTQIDPSGSDLMLVENYR